MMLQKNMRLGMISVPWQQYTAPLAPAESLRIGTVFSELNQPYTPLNCNQPVMKPVPGMAMMNSMQKKR